MMRSRRSFFSVATMGILSFALAASPVLANSSGRVERRLQRRPRQEASRRRLQRRLPRRLREEAPRRRLQRRLQRRLARRLPQEAPWRRLQRRLQGGGSSGGFLHHGRRLQRRLQRRLLLSGPREDLDGERAGEAVPPGPRPISDTRFGWRLPWSSAGWFDLFESCTWTGLSLVPVTLDRRPVVSPSVDPLTSAERPGRSNGLPGVGSSGLPSTSGWSFTSRPSSSPRRRSAPAPTSCMPRGACSSPTSKPSTSITATTSSPPSPTRAHSWRSRPSGPTGPSSAGGSPTARPALACSTTAISC